MSSLRQLITEYLAEHAGQALKPWEISEGLTARGQHVGVAAVHAACQNEAAHGRLIQEASPIRFMYPKGDHE